MKTKPTLITRFDRLAVTQFTWLAVALPLVALAADDKEWPNVSSPAPFSSMDRDQAARLRGGEQTHSFQSRPPTMRGGGGGGRGRR